MKTPSRRKSAARIKSAPASGAGKPDAGVVAAATQSAPGKKSVSPAKFVRNVRSELAKVVWPTRKETMVTTMMVFIMVTVLAVFFFAVDQLLSYGISQILGLGA